MELAEELARIAQEGMDEAAANKAMDDFTNKVHSKAQRLVSDWSPCQVYQIRAVEPRKERRRTWSLIEVEPSRGRVWDVDGT